MWEQGEGMFAPVHTVKKTHNETVEIEPRVWNISDTIKRLITKQADLFDRRID